MKRIRRWLEESDIALEARPGKGYRIVCGELTLRKALLRWALEAYGDELPNLLLTEQADLTGVPDSVLSLFQNTNFRALSAAVDRLLADLGAHLNRDRYIHSVLYLAILTNRLSEGHALTAPANETDAADETLSTLPWRAFRRRLELLLALPLPERELAVVRTCLFPPMPSRPQPDSAQTAAAASQITAVISESAERLLGIPFVSDATFQAELQDQVLNILQNAEDLPQTDTPELELFSAKYPLEFALGRQIISLAQQELGETIPETGGKLIGMFIAAQLEKISYARKRRKRVLLVSASSLSASMLIYWQLMNNFSSQMEIVKIASYKEILGGRIPPEIDLVLSTINLNNLNCSNLVISPILKESDIDALRRYLSDSGGTERLALIPLYDDASRDSSALFARVSALLQEGGYAGEGYCQALERHEATYGSGIEAAVPVALPHTGPQYTRRETLVAVVTASPISYRLIGGEGRIETRIHLFPLLRQASPQSGFSFYSAVARLRDKKVAAELLRCTSAEEIRRVLGG